MALKLRVCRIENTGRSPSGSAANARSRALLSFALFRCCYGGCLNGEAQPSRSFIQAPTTVPKSIFAYLICLKMDEFCVMIDM